MMQIEGYVFRKVAMVHFPSNGTMSMYFSDDNGGCDQADCMIGPPIYNTALPELSLGPSKISLPVFSGITFVTVGTLTHAKGQDKVLKFSKKPSAHISWDPLDMCWQGHHAG